MHRIELNKTLRYDDTDIVTYDFPELEPSTESGYITFRIENYEFIMFTPYKLNYAYDNEYGFLVKANIDGEWVVIFAGEMESNVEFLLNDTLWVFLPVNINPRIEKISTRDILDLKYTLNNIIV